MRKIHFTLSLKILYSWNHAKNLYFSYHVLFRCNHISQQFLFSLLSHFVNWITNPHQIQNYDILSISKLMLKTGTHRILAKVSRRSPQDCYEFSVRNACKTRKLMSSLSFHFWGTNTFPNQCKTYRMCNGVNIKPWCNVHIVQKSFAIDNIF